MGGVGWSKLYFGACAGQGFVRLQHIKSGSDLVG